MKRWWMIRAGDDNELIPIWREKGVASIGWAELKNPKAYLTKQDLILKANTVYEDSKPQTRIAWVSQVWRFSHETKL